jgi:hypothetical protein
VSRGKSLCNMETIGRTLSHSTIFISLSKLMDFDYL